MKSGATTSNGRMTRYQNAATSTDASYAYDALGQRTKSTATVSGTTTTTNFTYDGLTLLKLSAVQGPSSWRLDYLYDEGGSLYGGVYRSPANSTSPTAFSVITNGHGDVLELLDANGAAFAAYRYDPWGKPVGLGGMRRSGNYATGVWTQATSLVTSTLAGQIASRQMLRYASYAYDAESGLYYCSARYYDPATRQWTTADPAKADGEGSAYLYCGGEPVNRVDPSGRHYGCEDNPKRTDSQDRVRLHLRVWWNECRVDGGNGLFGVQLLKLSPGATVLKSAWKLSRLVVEYGMGSNGHCTHVGGGYDSFWHATHHWLWPTIAPPVSGQSYGRYPGCSDHYNVRSQTADDCGWLWATAKIYFFNKDTGKNANFEVQWDWKPRSSNP